MHILFYYSSNKRTVSLESIILALQQRGYQVQLLTICQRGDLHEYLEQNGVITHTNISGNNGIWHFLAQVCHLILYCRKYQIDFAFSHLQQANIIAVVAQYFTKAKFFIFRHHFKFIQNIKDENLDVNQNEHIADKLINKLAKTLVVPSQGVYNGIITYESINKSKLRIVPYTYKFSNYQSVSEKAVQSIKLLYDAHLLIVMCARLTKFKRHKVAFEVFATLIKQGFDIKVMVMDEGEEKEVLTQYVYANTLQDRIVFLGYKKNILDYIAAADLLVHPSVTEASNSIVKEAAFVSTAVIVCKGVGDFDSYITNERNGFTVSIEHTAEELNCIIEKVYSEKEILSAYARKLRSVVINKFGENSESTLAGYENLMH